MNYPLPPFGLGMCAPKKPTRKKASPEKDIQKAIQQAFRLRYTIALVHVDSGAASMRQGQGKGQGGHSATPAGFPDLVGVVPPQGWAIYVEVKAPGNRPTELQTRMLELLRNKGAIAFWADSVESACQQFEQARRGRVA
jgi:hypothetical protein